MTATLNRPTLTSASRVGIVDDRDDSAFAIEVALAEFCTPVRIPLTHTLEDLLNNVARDADFAVFDHRFGDAPFPVNYTGAQATASSPVPAVLVTTYIDTDRAAIRQFQSNIPKVLTRGGGALSPADLHAALEVAADEQSGHRRPERVPYRTVVRVVNIEPYVVPRVQVVVTAWRPGVEVTVPAQLITVPTGLSLNQLRGHRFLADVNIYAENSADLFFANFDEASALPDGWMQAGLAAETDE